MGLEVGESSSISAVSEVAGIVVSDEDRRGADVVVVAGGLLRLERLFLDLGAGLHGHVCESCPACLHLGQAFSEPGHDAKTLKPRISKRGVADSGFPSPGSFSTISQQFVWSGKPFTMCGASSTISPWVDQRERSCCSTMRDASTGTFTNLMGTYLDGVPAGGRGCESTC